ncbi:exosome RNA helicase MTR4-like [Asterias rubens]|uniref:exosome RNA helicase MTR4-like n=1 Tax=Asterias rubens TaxID=7604 RepID=UPI001455D0C6|nr:exosome RNA helicase MTR4-like [Asterias rubens]
MAGAFGGDLFSVFDDNADDKKSKKQKGHTQESSDGRELSSVGDQERKRPQSEDHEVPDYSTGKKPKLALTADELNLAEILPQVRSMTVESPDGCNHEVAIPHDEEYIPLKPTGNKAAKEYPFILDPFQREALKCLENQQSVLVSAHTSAGKTVVAEYAIAMSLRDKQRVIYTTPIKALSNQKYRELYEEFQDVGLMTGDVTINPTASCLIMTTEILRSMLYRGSEIMREVAWVVFDEIHYMRDKNRGVVWEETIILLPDNVHYVFLSATIPNARQFAEWICHLHKQPCHVVYTEYRPVPLQHYIFPSGGDGLHLVVDEKGEFRQDNFNSAMSVLRDAGDAAKGDAMNKGRKGGTKGPSNIFKIVKMIMERMFQPVIVFSFSKKECEAYAMQMSKLDFNSTQEEKKLVTEVFNNAIDCLSDEDKKLPQVENVLPLLKRGIGIHHSGLLPILKETIEILFGEGLIKALFATETFAMGLNMPARTVVFTNARKFDGKGFRWLSSGEYIQMSGRAGRRGLDDKGIVILMIDEKMSPGVGKTILQGLPDPLNSAFHLTYNMVLNLLRVEGINPEYMLEKSFYQFQNYAVIPELFDKLKRLEDEYNKTDIPQEESVEAYYKIRQQLNKLGREIQSFITKPKYCLPFLQPGRLVQVKNEDDDFGWGVVINFRKKANQKMSSPKDDSLVYIAEILLNCSKESVKNSVTDSAKPPKEGEKGEMAVVPVLLNLITHLSSVRLYLPKDLRPIDNRQSVGKSIQEVQRRFPDSLPLLDPTEDMGIKDEVLKRVVEKVEAFEERMYSHPLHKSPELSRLYGLYEEKAKIASEVKAAKRELKRAKTVIQLEELKCRKRVIRRLGYATVADVIEMKGRVACEISSGDELLLTELIFNGVFNSLKPEQIVALLSCFVFEEKSKNTPRLSEQLSGPLRQMQDSARRIAKVSVEAKLQVEEEDYVESFKPQMMDVVFAWANGSTFAEICKMTDVFEGSIIRCMRRLEELMREMCHAAKAIGNTELENKFARGIVKIKRDIVFAASLYL